MYTATRIDSILPRDTTTLIYRVTRTDSILHHTQGQAGPFIRGSGRSGYRLPICPSLPIPEDGDNIVEGVEEER